MNGSNLLLIGGSFTSNRGNLYYLSAWDGSKWDSIGDTNGPVNAFAINGSENLFIGGSFTMSGGGTACTNNVAQLSTTRSSPTSPNWKIVGNGISYDVYALTMNGTNQLFVGGTFSSVGGSSVFAYHIASWDGNSWNFLGTNSTNNGVNGIVYSLAMNGTSNLFVGGYFSSVDGGSISANNIASWNGNSWNILGKNSTNNGINISGQINALAMNGTNQLFVGGLFSIVDGSILANNIATWDGNSWNILGTNSTNNGIGSIVYSLVMNGTNQLFVGGSFSSVDGGSILANKISSWNGNSWNILGTNSTHNGVDNIVYSLAMNGTNNLFVGGEFSSVDGGSILANNIASWNGSFWNFLGTNSTSNGVDTIVYTIAMNGTNQLFVGGSFTRAGGSLISAKNIASWDGNSWYSFGSGSDNDIHALAINSTNSIFVGGFFSFSPDGFCTPYLMKGRLCYFDFQRNAHLRFFFLLLKGLL